MKNPRFIAKFAVSAALLVLLWTRIDVPDALGRMARLQPATIVAALAFYVAALLIATAKWKLLMPGFRYGVLLRMNLIGQFYSLALPGQLAGEAVKAYRLGKGSPDAPAIAASVLADRITGLIGLLILSLTAVVFTPTHPGRALSLLLATSLAVVVAIPLVLASRHFQSLTSRLSSRSGFLRAVAGFLQRVLIAWNNLMTSPRLVLLSILAGVVYQASSTVVSVVLASALGIDVALLDWFWVFGVVSVVTLLPFTIGGIGLREASFVGVLGLLGVASEKALALSLSLFAILLLGAVCGAVLDWSSPRAAAAKSPLPS